MAKKESRAEVVFKDELEYIISPYLKKFVIECFDKLSADYFWDFTASSSGKHHPKIANKKHGLVLHTKLCVWWGRKLAESFDCDQEEINIIVSSLLLHDLQKFGKILDENRRPTLSEYCLSHGPLLAIQINKLFDEYSQKEKNKVNKRNDYYVVDKMSACIALHMGIWTSHFLGDYWDKIYRDDKTVKVVQLADYCASRKVDDKMEELDKFNNFGE